LNVYSVSGSVSLSELKIAKKADPDSDSGPDPEIIPDSDIEWDLQKRRTFCALLFWQTTPGFMA